MQKIIFQSLNEWMSQNQSTIALEDLINWLNDEFTLVDEDKKEIIINFIDKQGVTLEDFNDILNDYYDEVDDFSKKLIDEVISIINEEFELQESFKNKLSETEIVDVIKKYFEEAENYALENLPKKYSNKEFDNKFNEYIKNKEYKLKNDNRNFYKIFIKYSPQ